VLLCKGPSARPLSHMYAYVHCEHFASGAAPLSHCSFCLLWPLVQAAFCCRSLSGCGYNSLYLMCVSRLDLWVVSKPPFIYVDHHISRCLHQSSCTILTTCLIKHWNVKCTYKSLEASYQHLEYGSLRRQLAPFGWAPTCITLFMGLIGQ
jgi:hypothetical protein